MHKSLLREAILSQYSPSGKTNHITRKTIIKKPKNTLEDFYREVHAKNQALESYHNKNAQDIELIMKQNRQMIDSKQ